MKCFNMAETFTMVCQNGKYNYSSLRLSRVSKKIYVFENKYIEGSHIYTYKGDSSFHID